MIPIKANALIIPSNSRLHSQVVLISSGKLMLQRKTRPRAGHCTRMGLDQSRPRFQLVYTWSVVELCAGCRDGPRLPKDMAHRQECPNR